MQVSLASSSFSNIFLRVGAALAFLYPPFNALYDPNSWVGYFPPFVPHELWVLHAFGVVEVVIGLWILSGYKIFWPSLAATAILLCIVAFNLPQFQVLFRDLSVAALTLALALINRPRPKVSV